MKKLMSCMAVCLLATYMLASHTYVSSSVLSSGTFVKLRVSESGLHTITFDEIKSLGLDPASVRIYGYGGGMLPQDFQKSKHDDLPIVPIYLDKGADGVFNSGDRLIFYAQGPITWSYNGSRFLHTRNPYSDYGYYFLSSGQGPTLEIPTESPIQAITYTEVTTFTDYRLHENDYINLIDRTGEAGGGREFYGEQFAPDTTKHFQFTFSNLITKENAFRWFINLAAYSSDQSTFTISMDGDTSVMHIGSISTSEFYERAKSVSSNKELTPTSESRKDIAIRFTNRNATALGFLNYIELNATCSLRMEAGNVLAFRSPINYATSLPVCFTISNATATTEIWDVTDPADCKRLTTVFDATTNTLRTLALNTEVHEYIALDPHTAICKKPKMLDKISNQNLHALQDIDYVIITPEAFAAEAERLAAAHAQYDNMTTAVVTDMQVYNEFSSGTPDATAYRWLMKMLYDRALRSGGTIQQPRYLCLFGDGSFDNRNLLKGLGGKNWLLTYQATNSIHEVHAYATDDYFAFLDDNEGEIDINGRMDIGVGRLPINSIDQATAVVDKLIRQIKGESKGKWKNQLIFLADDGDSNLHTSCSDLAGEAVRKANPDFITNKIYLDAYTQEVNASGESYPLAEARINNLLNQGALLFDYCGHSGYNNASSEGLVTIAGIRAMQNSNPSFWIFASCSFGHFDAGKVSAAEEAVLNPNGGAIAVCAACRTVYANQNAVLNKNICDALFDHATPFGYHNRIGDAVRLGKNACGSDENKMAYILIGDPATSLHFPTEYQVVTSAISDTLHALDVAQVEGFIQSEEGDTATWFNGKLHICIYDNMQRITTLDNDQPDESEKKKYTYNDYPNVLFQGETTITNGRFTYTFMVPKDIRYNFDNGRIVYYALDSITHEEGVGHFHDFVVGGSSVVEIFDQQGPDIQLYLGSHAFQNGGKVCETPYLYADIADEHGINTVGSGIGHDLLLIVDGKPSETYILNDYYSSVNNSYQQGIVTYQMAELKEGPHQLFFRAWDLLNNSSSTTLDFEVVKGFDPSITNLIIAPASNAEGEWIDFIFEHDRPDVIMNATIRIYDVAGRLLYEQDQRGEETIRWNITESPVPAGVYIYNIQLSSSSTKTCSKSGKIIITK